MIRYLYIHKGKYAVFWIGKQASGLSYLIEIGRYESVTFSYVELTTFLKSKILTHNYNQEIIGVTKNSYLISNYYSLLIPALFKCCLNPEILWCTRRAELLYSEICLIRLGFRAYTGDETRGKKFRTTPNLQNKACLTFKTYWRWRWGKVEIIKKSYA